MLSTPDACKERITLIVASIHLILRKPVSGRYIEIISKHVARRLSRSEKNDLVRSFKTDATLRVMNMVTAMISEGEPSPGAQPNS